MEQDLIQQETQRLHLQEKFNSREEQIVSLTSKLEKLWQSFRSAMAEIDDLQHEFQAEREDLLDTIRRLIRDVKYQATIVKNFIPEEELAVSSFRWGLTSSAFLLPHRAWLVSLHPSLIDSLSVHAYCSACVSAPADNSGQHAMGRRRG